MTIDVIDKPCAHSLTKLSASEYCVPDWYMPKYVR